MALRSRTGRAEAWRTLAQRGVDTAAELSDVLAQKLGAAADPRAKMLRKRRWALRAGLFFTFSTGLWIVVTAVLASWNTPAWALPIPGAIAVGAAFLATLSLPALPLAEGHAAAPAALGPPASAVGIGGPPADGGARVGRARDVRPARRDAARPDAAGRRVARGDGGGQPDRGHHGGHRHRGGVDGAGRGGVARSPGRTWRPPSARSPRSWRPGFGSTTKWSPPQRNWCQPPTAEPMSSSPMSAQRYRHELGTATDRLSGWAQAFDELGHLRRA